MAARQMIGADVAVQIAGTRAGVAVQHPDAGHPGEFLGVAGLRGTARVVDEADVAVEAFRAQGAQHRHHRGDAAPAGDEQDPPGGTVQRESACVAGRDADPDHHARVREIAQKGRHPSALVAADGQLDQRRPLGVGRRIAARVPTAVDLDGEIDVPTGPKFGVQPCAQRVRLQREGDAARRARAAPRSPWPAPRDPSRRGPPTRCSCRRREVRSARSPAAIAALCPRGRALKFE